MCSRPVGPAWIWLGKCSHWTLDILQHSDMEARPEVYFEISSSLRPGVSNILPDVSFQATCVAESGAIKPHFVEVTSWPVTLGPGYCSPTIPPPRRRDTVSILRFLSCWRISVFLPKLSPLGAKPRPTPTIPHLLSVLVLNGWTWRCLPLGAGWCQRGGSSSTEGAKSSDTISRK